MLVAIFLCVLLTGCTPEVQQNNVTKESGTQITVTEVPALESEPELPPESTPETPPVVKVVTEDIFEPVDDLPVPPAIKPAWAILASLDSQNTQDRNKSLLEAANSLLASSRIAESTALVNLIEKNELSDADRAIYDFLKIRYLQFENEHQKALFRIRYLKQNADLDSEQMLRLQRLKVYSISQQDNSVSLIAALIDLHSMLPDGSERIATAHQIWLVLKSVSVEQMSEAIQELDNPIQQQWLQLAVSANKVQHDPYQFNEALSNWLSENPDHPAQQLITEGLAIDPIEISKIAVLLPLSSKRHAAAQAFLDGLTAQHSLNSSPTKPQLEIIDIGGSPKLVTQFYYQAVDLGADYVVGPIGIDYVEEISTHGDLLLPTLLLGNAVDVELPEHVLQFSLAPESEGIDIARQARHDGHSMALVLEHPSSWSKRTVDAFRQEWGQLGGVVIDSHEFSPNQSDYSQIIKAVLNITSSAERYGEVRQLTEQRMNFNPRHRQDIEFIVLTADAVHGRLIKPHIDFLGAIDLPIYSTHHIFTGEISKIRDQDMDGIQFTDMGWMVDRSANMSNLKKRLTENHSVPIPYQRLFAMGVDAYNFVFRSLTLQHSSDARLHGVSALLAVDEQGNVVRTLDWAQFVDGEPHRLIEFRDPERSFMPVRFSPSIVLPAPR